MVENNLSSLLHFERIRSVNDHASQVEHGAARHRDLSIHIPGYAAAYFLDEFIDDTCTCSGATSAIV